MDVKSYVSRRLDSLSSHNEYYLIKNMLSILEDKFNVFKIRHGGMNGHVLIKIDHPRFWDDFNRWYKYLYPERSYYVWHKYILSGSGLRLSRSRLKVRKQKRNFILNRDGNRCVLCGTAKNLTVDHVTPLSKGGDNSFYNLVTMCHNCNNRKGSCDYGFDFIIDVVVKHIKKVNNFP